MPFGIILHDCADLGTTQANFYVPALSPLDTPVLEKQKNASHVFLHNPCSTLAQLSDLLSQLDVSRDVTVLIRLPEWTNFDDFHRVVEEAGRKFAIIVPVAKSKPSFFMLRAFSETRSENVKLVLELCESVPERTITRYKCLKYVTVLLNPINASRSSGFYDDAAELLRKSASPVLLLYHDLSTSDSYAFWRSLSDQQPDPFSDMLIDPLQPLATDMDLDIYETFERDHVKYAQYKNAIEMAVSDLSHMHSPLNILVLGPGRGPLLKMVMEFARDSDLIMAVEKNLKCRQNLENICEEWTGNLELAFEDVRTLSHSKLSCFHLVVSELMGSFGCNEAAPEILSVFRDFSPVMIPQETQSFIQPIYTDILTDQVTLNRPFLAKLNSYFPVCGPVPAFEFTYPEMSQLNQQRTFTFLGDSDETINAFYGYFEAVLYGPYRIGILPKQSKLESCSSWFPMLFPIPKTAMPVLVTFRRKSLTSLSYEWVVNGTSYGQEYKVSLDR